MSHVGVNLGFGNLHENLTDEQMYMGEVAIAELADRLGFDSLWAVEHHCRSRCFGTPDQILKQVAGIRDVLGDFQLIVIPSFGGLPYDHATRSLELFAKEVMPGVRELQG